MEITAFIAMIFGALLAQMTLSKPSSPEPQDPPPPLESKILQACITAYLESQQKPST